MRTQIFRVRLFASVGASFLAAATATAQLAASTSGTAPTSAPANTAPATLPYGVEDVLKLTRAQISEDVILNFIRNSGTIYSLAPTHIVYLRNEGVSDRVINTMLDQRKTVPAETAAQPAAPQTTVGSDANGAPAPQYAPAYVQPPPTPVAPQPAYTPASTVYVIPYEGPSYGYANYYPYYYGRYYDYAGPSVVFRFGYGGGSCGPYYRGYPGRYWGGGYYGHRGHY